MAVYEYRAADVDASAVAGTVVADTPRQARDMLRGRGLTISEVKEVATRGNKSGWWRWKRTRNQTEVMAFIRDLMTLVATGIPLLPALQTLAAQAARRFKVVIQSLADEVAAGTNLAEAMSRRPDCFDEMCVSIVQVGENTGSLETALRHLAEFKEKTLGLRSRVITAMLYPAVVFFFGIAVSLFLMTYVVPSLLVTLTQAGRQLPTVTRLVKGVSDFLVRWWWCLLGGALGLALAIRFAFRTRRGHLAADRILLRIPLIGELIRKENTSRIAIVLSVLLQSGLQFVDAIRIARRTVRNRVFQLALEEYEQAVIAGGDIAGPLARSGVFRPMVIQMLAVGQQSGRLEEMLQQLSQTYDQHVTTATQRLTAILEPVLIVLLAVLVGFIALAVVLPILEMSNAM